MDHLSTEDAFREFFATRHAACDLLMQRLVASGACSEYLTYEIGLIQERSASLLKIDMLYLIRKHHWATRGAGKKLAGALLGSLTEAAASQSD